MLVTKPFAFLLLSLWFLVFICPVITFESFRFVYKRIFWGTSRCGSGLAGVPRGDGGRAGRPDTLLDPTDQWTVGQLRDSRGLLRRAILGQSGRVAGTKGP